ncbi:probable H/ACA ribonucleoprotein complex subunit 1 [Oryza brachyantha]|uniref:HMA domain-containing protein n=1 Tax=Oryza brachyantha TaxID=4533 RepID=J3MW17_ORYBR|nr:probable H/ACA ribonucleoprotein complex subunit 1 [Oryza brachyantha]
MAKQKFVLKMPLDTEKKKRKAFKAAVGMTGVTSASLEGDKIIVIGDGVDPIALTTMLRRSLGHAELLSISSGDDKKMMGGGHGGMGMGAMGFGGGHGGGGGGMGMGFGGGKEGKESGGRKVVVDVDGVHHHEQQQQQHAMAPTPPYPGVPAYQQYNAVPSYPVYPSYPGYPQEEQDPSCSIM